METFSLPKFGAGCGLHRVEWLLESLGVSPAWLSRAAIAITGSNGKGTTAIFADAIGRAHGLKTGLFTSPHLYDPRERFRIGGQLVPEEVLDDLEAEALRRVAEYEQSDPGDTFGSFEVLFAIGAAWFHREKCDLVVLEAGIGGRFDPVRAAGAKVAAVVSLDYEHTELLGTSLEAICFDKTDICSSPGTMFYGRSALPFEPRVRAYCRLRSLEPSFVGRDLDREISRMDEAGLEMTAHIASSSVPLTLSLHGEYQADNALLALALVREWIARSGRKFAPVRAAEGLHEVRYPGRLEVIRGAPLTLIDVGHTPAAVRAAKDALFRSFPDRRWILVTGVSQNKKIEEILDVLLPDFDEIVCTAAYHKGAPASEILTIAERLRPVASYHLAPTTDEAARLALERGSSTGAGIYAAGGLFLAAEVAVAVAGGDPRALQFY